MRGFIVHPEHINVLIWAGLQRVGHSEPPRWHFDNPTDIRELTPGNATHVGRMLLDENTASVNHLYTERDRFRDPVCARAARDTYRTFLVREIPGGARNPETRRATVPIRALFGTGDAAIHTSLIAPETANADDYTLETTDASHFVIDERPDLVRAKPIALAEEKLNPSRARHCLILAGPVPLEAGGQVP
jgi:pimeloyl-ACP methyl ester carboxylesterase